MAPAGVLIMHAIVGRWELTARRYQATYRGHRFITSTACLYHKEKRLTKFGSDNNVDSQASADVPFCIWEMALGNETRNKGREVPLQRAAHKLNIGLILQT